jgi:hypothetical protein
MVYLNPSTTCQELISLNLTELSKQLNVKKLSATRVKNLEIFLILSKEVFITILYITGSLQWNQHLDESFKSIRLNYLTFEKVLENLCN